MNLGKTLRLLRLSKDLKQAQLSTTLGISRSHLCELESGKKTPSLDLLKKYSEFFGIPVSQIFLMAERGVEIKLTISETDK